MVYIGHCKISYTNINIPRMENDNPVWILNSDSCQAAGLEFRVMLMVYRLSTKNL